MQVNDMFVNYAHRGASEYAPENTLSAFYLGIQMKANGIETDIRRSKDGVLVLFHDDTLERVAGIQLGVNDLNLDELKKILIYGNKGFIPDRIVTLEEFLQLFAYRDLTFAIEIKEKGVEADTVELIRKYNALDKCIFTSFDFESLCALRKVDASIRLGYLVQDCSREYREQAKSIQCYQLCIKAENLTEQGAEEIYKEGFSIRAWGITNETMMQKALKLANAGMTINFPDKLSEESMKKIL